MGKEPVGLARMVDLDSIPLLHQAFEARAFEVPDHIALQDPGGSITFGELAGRAGRITAALQHLGIHEGGTVGLHLERSIDWVAACLGILATGSAVVPLPPEYPPGRLDEILAHGRLDAVIDGCTPGLATSCGTHVVRMEGLLRKRAAEQRMWRGSPDAAAFVLCSSGSTGHPKMIVRSHRSFFHRLHWTWRTHPFGEQEIGCQKAPATTTHGVYELFEPLLAGVPTRIIPDTMVRDQELFWETVRASGVTRLLVVPSALQTALDMPDFCPPHLKVLVLMGEYVSRSLAQRTVAAFPAETALYSIYGSTEASSALVCNLRESIRQAGELPLGVPISPEVRAYVLDPGGKDVGAGHAGRLYLGGPLLFSGYFRDPELTRGTLLEAPGRPEVLYDTKDDVRVADDGSFEFVGRSDDVVKVRGFRVDLKEVENALLSCQQVRQAVAIIDSSGAGSPLVAFVTPATVSTGAVYPTLRAKLPAYSVPSVIVPLDTLPLTVRGKMDRQALLERLSTVQTARRSPLPNSEPERTVATAWKETLGHDGFQPDDSFFEVGGTSLSAFTLVRNLREAFLLDRRQLPEEAIFRHSSVAAQAVLISRLLAGEIGDPPDETPLSVTLRSGRDKTLPPLFMIASAGGTTGAYEKLARALETPREIVGIPDPFLWGRRDPDSGFASWVGLYLQAIRAKQPEGPYCLCAYSSAGAFGYELARCLQAAGQAVDVLVLIDPLALDRGSRKRFGWWALRATYSRSVLRSAVKLAGLLRRILPTSWLRAPASASAPVTAESRPRETPPATAEQTRHRVLTLSALFELNSGLPVTIDEQELRQLPPERCMDLLKDKVRQLIPELDPERIDRIAVQYPMQVHAQHAYVLKDLRTPVLLFEPDTKYAGLLESLLRPHVARLTSRILQLGAPSTRICEVTRRFGPLAAHYRSMRDDSFVEALAKEIDAWL